MSGKPEVERKRDTVVIKIPMDLKRRSGRKEIIVPEGLPGTESRKSPTQEPLLTALARAFHWQELIDSGRYASVRSWRRRSGWTAPTSGGSCGWRFLRLTSCRRSSRGESRAGCRWRGW